MNFLNSSPVEFFSGLTLGYTYLASRKAEKEITQGKNYYVAAPFLTDQLTLLSSLVDSLCQTFFQNTPWSPRVNLVTTGVSLMAFPLTVLATSVKQENYPALVRPFKTALTPLKHFSETGSDWIRLIFLATALGLLARPKKAFAAGILCAMGYQLLEERHVVAKKITLFVETYMPTLHLLGALLKGNLPLKLQALLQLNSLLFYEGLCAVQRIIDCVLRSFLYSLSAIAPRYGNLLQLPSIAAIDSPPKLKNTWHYSEILSILQASPEAFENTYEICAFSCAQAVFSCDDFPKDRQFDQLLDLFDQIDWVKKQNLLVKKLQDDERFVYFLAEKLQTGREEVKKNFLALIQELATAKNLSSEAFLMDWIREQLKALIDNLNGRLRGEGSEKDRLEVIEYASILLPYILSLPREATLEDILLKIAVEGGGYCHLGVRRVFDELFSSFIASQQKIAGLSPEKTYEKRVLYALERLRKQILDSVYHLLDGVWGKTIQDIHFYNEHQSWMGLGFIPLAQSERRKIDFLSLAGRYAIANAIPIIHKEYRIRCFEEINQLGKVHLTKYLLSFIHNNPLLSPEEKEGLLEMYSGDRPFGSQTYQEREITKRFQRLLLIQWGVLVPRPKPKAVLLFP